MLSTMVNDVASMHATYGKLVWYNILSCSTGYTRLHSKTSALQEDVQQYEHHSLLSSTDMQLIQYMRSGPGYV